MDEKDLIEQIKINSHEAFNILYKLYARKLYAFCLSYTKSEDDSNDIVQDVFEKVWKNRNSLNSEESVSSLIFTIAKHEIINSYKKNVNSQLYEEYIIYKKSISLADDKRLDYKFYLELVQKKMELLSKTQQKVIRLSRFEGLSIKEISTRINLKEETVRNQISLGTKKLKIILGAEKYLDMLLIINYLFL